MSKTEMPAAEVSSYELAYHVLPTVAEGEVANVTASLKEAITKHGGTITTEEEPERIDLAYDIVKPLEGRNRKFSSAYFGWVRFEIDPAQIEEINEVLEHTNGLLRHLLIKLTKVEAAHPFFYHEAMATLDKKVETVEVDEQAVVVEVTEEIKDADEESTKEVAEEGAKEEETKPESEDEEK